MTRFPAFEGKEVVEILKGYDFFIDRQRGSHAEARAGLQGEGKRGLEKNREMSLFSRNRHIPTTGKKSLTMLPIYSIIILEDNIDVFAPRWISRKASGGVIYFQGAENAG